MPDLSKAIEWLKLSPRYLLAAVIATGAYLILRPHQLAMFGLNVFDDEIRPWVSLAFLICSSLLLAHAISSCGTWLQERWEIHVSERRQRASVLTLSKDEKDALLRAIGSGSKTLYFSATSGVAGGLERQNFIFRSSSLSTRGAKFAYTLQPWAWEYLNNNRELLSSGKDDEKEVYPTADHVDSTEQPARPELAYLPRSLQGRRRTRG